VLLLGAFINSSQDYLTIIKGPKVQNTNVYKKTF